MKEFIRIYDPDLLKVWSFDKPTQVRYIYDGMTYYGIAMGKKILSVKNGEFYAIEEMTKIEFFVKNWVDTEFEDYKYVIMGAWQDE